MNIDRLKYFLDLSKTLNYTETAEQFFTTQGNISKQIIALEKELDTLLFSREHRKIALTPAGKALLPYAEKILSDYEEFQAALIPFQNPNHSILKIGTIPVMRNYKVAGLISKFHQNYPDILLDVTEVESIYLLKELDLGTYDIAFVRIFDLNSNHYEKITAGYDEFAAVLPITHPLSDREKISLTELKEESFYQLDQSTQLINQFYFLCNKAGFKPKLNYTGTHIDNILDFVSNGMGVSLMMGNAIRALNVPGISVVPLDITLKSELAFIRSKHQKPSAASNYFWKYLSHLLSHVHENKADKS
ncbi:LysR family transcriptional regulator [Konateibacter massiliensis]|uniref:LysR family transcriptional regulator n=1 Tax=Konateibacter massiliensis TaxID=2002841 RepID=UPI000C16204E|nr:LysR family transcriptional regulator [Konateibacter massiliensis]